MFYYLYQTTNLLNSKVYVGVHATNNLDDGYLGSGKALLLAIRKYGKESFKKDILEYFSSREEMYQKEREVITQEFVERADTYNMTLGGLGAYKGRPSWCKGLKAYWATDGFRGHKRSDEWKAKQAEVPKRMKWYTNGEDNLYLRKEMSPPAGYYPGRIRSEEQKRKTSESLINTYQNRTEEGKQKDAQAAKRKSEKLKGRSKSIETRRKISETLKKRKENETTNNDTENIEN